MDYKGVFRGLYDALDCVERAEKSLKDLYDPEGFDVLTLRTTELGAAVADTCVMVEGPLREQAKKLREVLKRVSDAAKKDGVNLDAVLTPEEE